MTPEIEAFVKAKSEGIRHSGRGFYEHLRGTYELLAGAPERVRYAGLCHSIYGTNVFKTAAVPAANRHEVIAVIGAEAERLAYIFCSCNRPSALIKAARNGPPFHVGMFDLTGQDLLDLLTIEEANLIEQSSLGIVSEVQRARRAMQEWNRA
jgi:hypothetical protein